MPFKEEAAKHIERYEQEKKFLMQYLIKVGKYYGATQEEIDQEFKDVLAQDNIELALTCYRSVLNSLPIKMEC